MTFECCRWGDRPFHRRAISSKDITLLTQNAESTRRQTTDSNFPTLPGKQTNQSHPEINNNVLLPSTQTPETERGRAPARTRLYRTTKLELRKICKLNKTGNIEIRHTPKIFWHMIEHISKTTWARDFKFNKRLCTENDKQAHKNFP